MEINWNEAEKKMQQSIQDTVKEVNTKAKSCAVRASNALRNAEIHVMEGKRSGKVYKKPGTHGKNMSKQTKSLLKDYGRKLRSGQLYRASAPGEAPATRTGMLRMSWGIRAEGHGHGSYTAGIYTDVPYAEDLNDGTPGGKIKPRPYKDKIIEQAKPKVVSIFKEMTR